MTVRRGGLPQLNGELFLTDSGLETDLIFNAHIDLPEFASFPLVDDEAGRAALARYYVDHVTIASEAGLGIILEAATWRASSAWGARLGYDAAALRRVNETAVALLATLRAGATVPIVVSAALGPQADAYHPSTLLSRNAAQSYHQPQLDTLASTNVDMVHAMTMTYIDEAVGITSAAKDVGLPVAVSFTVETDGALPDGTPLAQAISATDEATDGEPVYYGVNCAHPTHFAGVFEAGAGWMKRVRCIRANASAMSHAELDAADALDAGDPIQLAAQYAELRADHPQLTVMGGCCGTDARHIRAIATRCG